MIVASVVTHSQIRRAHREIEEFCDEEKKINDTKIVLKNSVNGDLCANGTHSLLNSFT